YYHCNGAFFTEGDFVNCSQCQAWQISPNCLLNQASGGTCRSDAECIPGVCPTPRVTLTASIWHNCPLIGISCRIATNGGVAGVWGEAWCKYYGQTFISMDGYQYCNGQEYGEIFTGECPNI
ncbi:MAG: hypothetical protein ACREEM_28675, partial [Blastocatellia bacterium]